MTIETNISDEEIEDEFIFTEFGERKPRDLLEQGLLKSVCGYHSGSTLTQIMRNLGLISEKHKITKKGKWFLFAAFNDSLNTG